MAGSMTISGRVDFQAAESIAQQRLFHDLPALSADFLDVQITNAQMLLIGVAPIVLIPAQGVNRAVIVERILAVSDSAGGAWTETAGNLEVRYTASTVLLTLETTGFITTGTVQVRHQAPAEAVATPIDNRAVELFNNGAGEFGGGNVANSFSVRVYFRVVDTVAFS